MKLTGVFSLYQLAFRVSCQNISLSSLALPGAPPPSLPPIPKGFSVTPKPGPSDGLPIAKAFHCLTEVVFNAWVSRGHSASPVTKYVSDDQLGWTFDLRLPGAESVAWRNLTTVGWVVGKILENAVSDMGLDQQSWVKPRNGYTVLDPAGRALGRAVLSRRLGENGTENANLTDISSSSAAEPGAAMSNGVSTNRADVSNTTTGPLQAPQFFKLSYLPKEYLVHRRGLILLFLEFMYKHLYAWDPKTLLTTITGGRGKDKIFESEALFGNRLLVRISPSTARSAELTVTSIAQGLLLLVAALDKKDPWKGFTATVQLANELESFVAFAITEVESGSEIETFS